MHQVSHESLLHYRRGTVSGGTIEFEESVRYDNHAENPAVALLDNGLVLEVHSLGGFISRTGTLSLNDPGQIEWQTPIKVDEDTSIVYPAVASNGAQAVATCNDDNGVTHPELYYSVANLCTE